MFSVRAQLSFLKTNFFYFQLIQWWGILNMTPCLLNLVENFMNLVISHKRKSWHTKMLYISIIIVQTIKSFHLSYEPQLYLNMRHLVHQNAIKQTYQLVLAQLLPPWDPFQGEITITWLCYHLESRGTIFFFDFDKNSQPIRWITTKYTATLKSRRHWAFVFILLYDIISTWLVGLTSWRHLFTFQTYAQTRSIFTCNAPTSNFLVLWSAL